MPNLDNEEQRRQRAIDRLTEVTLWIIIVFLGTIMIGAAILFVVACLRIAEAT